MLCCDALNLMTTYITFQGTREEWQTVFFLCSGMYGVGFIVFMAWGSGEEQEWAKVKGWESIVF